MKDKTIPILIVLGFSIFCSLIMILPQRTLTSPLSKLAIPSVCGEGTIEIERISDVYVQGEGTHLVNTYCVNEQGEKREVSNELFQATSRLQLPAIIVVGLILFGLGMGFFHWAARRLNIPFEDLFKPSANRQK